jgi:cell division topological specificity factor
MSILKYLRIGQKNTAQIAKERLQIIVAHERQQRHGVINLRELQEKLIEVIADYLKIAKNEVQINIELEKDKNRSILEMNVTLPDQDEQAA